MEHIFYMNNYTYLFVTFLQYLLPLYVFVVEEISLQLFLMEEKWEIGVSRDQEFKNNRNVW